MLKYELGFEIEIEGITQMLDMTSADNLCSSALVVSWFPWVSDLKYLSPYSCHGMVLTDIPIYHQKEVEETVIECQIYMVVDKNWLSEFYSACQSRGNVKYKWGSKV